MYDTVQSSVTFYKVPEQHGHIYLVGLYNPDFKHRNHNLMKTDIFTQLSDMSYVGIFLRNLPPARPLIGWKSGCRAVIGWGGRG